MIKDYYTGQFILVSQRQGNTFIRLADGTKLITEPLLYKLYEKELFDLQVKMGQENKRILLQNPEYVEYRKKHKHSESTPHNNNCLITR